MHTMGEHHCLGPRPGTLHRPLRRLTAVGLAAALGLGLALAGSTPAGAVTHTAITARVSVRSTGAQVSAEVLPLTVADETGRQIAFSGTGAYDPEDTNGASDVYVRDRRAGTTTRVSLTGEEKQLAGSSVLCGASADLRFVAFWTNATNLPSAATGQIFVRDRDLGTTELVSQGFGASVKSAGGSGITAGARCDLSADGRYVVFASEGTNLVGDDQNGVADVFRRDRQMATTVRVSLEDDDDELVGYGSTDPQMSDDGAYVLFTTRAVVSLGDTNNATDVFRRHVPTGTTSPVSTTNSGPYAKSGAASQGAISGDGSVVAFTTEATTILSADVDENAADLDVYVVELGVRERVSVSSNEVQGDDDSSAPSLSHDGRYVAFTSAASNLWLFEANAGQDVFLRDRDLGLTTLASRRAGANTTSSTLTTGPPSTSGDGTAVAFASVAPDLVRKDTNALRDVFVRDADEDLFPFGSVDDLVAQQFADFAGRPPTAAEATEWRARLVHGEISADEAIVDLAHSSAWSQRRGPVTRLYWSFFLRAPEQAGLDYWVAQNAAGKGLHTIAGQFAQVKEFKDMYGALSNAAFVTLVYENVLERAPDPAGLAYWTEQLSSGATTRGSLMVGFSESPEGRTFLAPQVDVVLVYLGMFGKMPSKSTFTGYSTWIEGGVPLEDVVYELRYADAYADRVA